jgi:arylsulfatase A-like enzyme/Flp pilus assembly protein TadD
LTDVIEVPLTVERRVRLWAGVAVAAVAVVVGVVGVAGLVGVSSCARPLDEPLGRSGAYRGANVLLVTIDTLRKDRVGAFGSTKGLTPSIDGLAANGVRFTQAYSPAPMTLPAHASILTGLLPRRHGVRNNTGFRLDDRIPTLATRLKDAGYRTGAFLGAFVLDGRFGLSRGFDEYDDRFPRAERASFHYAQRRAAEVVKLAGDWILESGPSKTGPWFAWVHLYDPHAPYEAPAEYLAGHAPYDAEVAYADAMLGQFLARLRTAHALDQTVIVVTADHGESLGEHGETTHGLFAYDATLAVPLVIAAPRMRAATVDAPVTHADIEPTVLDLVAGPPPGAGDGFSLVRTPAADRPIYFEALDAYLTRGWAPLRGVIQSGWKFIDLPEAELYDLSGDPAEYHNRAGVDPHAATLKRALQLGSGPEASAPSPALDSDTAARLRSLGYTAGTPSRRPITVADDPKRLVALNERFNSALTAFDGGRTDEALSTFLSILRERPDFDAARTSAATALMATGRSHDAVELLREGLHHGDSPDLLAKLGSALRDDGNLAAAADAYGRARRAGNENPDVMNELAVVYARLGRVDEARALFKQLIDRDPKASTTWFNLGLFELQNRRPSEAVTAFQRAVALDPSYGDAWNALGSALVSVDTAGAIGAWQHAEPLLPRDYDLLFNLAMVLAASPTPAASLPYLRRFEREAPRDRYASDIARVHLLLARLERAAR